jgi:hypothetical protein
MAAEARAQAFSELSAVAFENREPVRFREKQTNRSIL